MTITEDVVSAVTRKVNDLSQCCYLCHLAKLVYVDEHCSVAQIFSSELLWCTPFQNTLL
jgi:hypothetical protein